MKKLYLVLFSVLAVNAYFVNPALALVPPVEVKGVPALSICPTTLAQATSFHSDKVVFKILPLTLPIPFTAAITTEQAQLNALPRNTELDIKISDNTRAVADIKSKVLTFLGAALTTTNSAYIQILSVEYATTVCPKFP